jgi:hypothetical protein
LGWGSRV